MPLPGSPKFPSRVSMASLTAGNAHKSTAGQPDLYYLCALPDFWGAVERGFGIRISCGLSERAKGCTPAMPIPRDSPSRPATARPALDLGTYHQLASAR